MNSKNLICFASAIILTKPSKSPLALARPNAFKGNFQPYNPLQKPLIALQFVLLQPLLAKYKQHQELDYNVRPAITSATIDPSSSALCANIAPRTTSPIA
jgi:hypothetical protein